MRSEPLWVVWLVTYDTCYVPNVPPKQVSSPIKFEQAAAIVERLGFGYCMKPEHIG